MRKKDFLTKFSTHRIGVGGICIKNEKILLVKHLYGFNEGKWIIPGGLVERSESISEALEREILEETGILTKPREIIMLRHSVREGKTQDIVSDLYLVFRTEYISGTLTPDMIEVSEARFVSLSDLDSCEIADLSKFTLLKAKEKGFIEHEYPPKKKFITDPEIQKYELFL